MDIISQIKELVQNDGNAIFGIADISYSIFKDTYLRAIIVAERYNDFISIKNYDEQKYDNMMSDIRNKIDAKINGLRQLFDKYGIKNYIPPATQTDEKTLIAPFSYKYAAVKAGLGWIGKNDVLITKKFGPRVRLSAILVDCPFNCGKAIEKSYCGNCHACVDACPYGCIKGTEWNITTKRDELIDYQLCNKKRSEFIKSTGRKHVCGYCILACPWGIK